MQRYKLTQGNRNLRLGKPNLLLVAHKVGRASLGGERSFIDILRAAAKRDINLFACLPNIRADYAKWVLDHTNGMLVFPYPQWRCNKPVDEKVVAAFVEILDSLKIDLIHVNTIMMSREPLIAARKCAVVSVVHTRELIDRDPDLAKVIGLEPAQIIKHVIDSADYIIANSKETANTYTTLERTFVLPNTVDVDAFDISNEIGDMISVAMVSVNDPKKGIHDFVNLANECSKQKISARFILVGPYNQHMDELFGTNHKNKIPTNLLYGGYYRSSVQAVSMGNIIVNFSSVAESFGRTVLEAMAARRPVIAYNWGALPELVQNGLTGHLVPYQDVHAALPLIKEMSEDHSLIQRLGARAREEAVTHYNQHIFSSELAKIYAAVLKNDSIKETVFLNASKALTNPSLGEKTDCSMENSTCRNAIPESSSQQEKPGVSIIVINHNGAHHLERLFTTFKRNNSYQPFEILVIDQSSTDHTDQLVKTWSEKAPIQLIKKDQAASFSSCCNDGAQRASYPYLLFLDNRIVYTEDVLPLALAQFNDQQVGVVSIRLDDDFAGLSPGERPAVQHVGIKFAWDETLLCYRPVQLRLNSLKEAEKVPNGLYPAVTAAFLLCRKDDFFAVGGFFEEYVHGYYNIDFCLQVRLKLEKASLCVNEISLQLAKEDRDNTSRTAIEDMFAFQKRFRDKLASLSAQNEKFFLSKNKKTRSSKDDDRLLKEMRKNISIAVIAWDLGHNPLGRAYMLAEALSAYYKVILLGPSFERYGNQIWEPLREADIPIISIPGSNFPEFATRLEEIAPTIDVDVIIACKPRLPSMQLGLLMKRYLNRPLIVDVDDYELSFFHNQTNLNFDQLRNNMHAYEDIDLPYGETWTRFSENLINYADDVFVSNVALQSRYGGQIIPHARDESVFNPALYSKAERRKELGISLEDKIVLFLGTPRKHKGIHELLKAMKACHNPRYKLCIMGDFPDVKYKQEILELGKEQVIIFPNQPFRELAKNLVIADVVCLLQDICHPIAAYQLPAKVVDAFAMGIPILATPTPPLKPLIDQKIVIPTTYSTLPEDLEYVLTHADELRIKQTKKRYLFTRDYSYAAITNKMEKAIFRCLNNLQRLPESALKHVELQRNMNAGKPVTQDVTINEEGYYDMILFWKQNDLGLYGRRVEMIAKYLSKHPLVRQVLLIEPPTAVEQMWDKLTKSSKTEHYKELFLELYHKKMGLRNYSNLSIHTFLYSDQEAGVKIWKYPGKDNYISFIDEIFKKHRVDMSRAVFWLYPRNFDLEAVIDTFTPSLIITDIVDDNRAWSNVTKTRLNELNKNYHKFLSVSDIAIANCTHVQTIMQQDFGQEVKLLPNACEKEIDFAHGLGPKSSILNKIKGPKLGYIGSLEEDKVDIDLLKFVASKRPEWNIILIGSTHSYSSELKKEALESLKDFPNIHFIGIVKYKHIPSWIKNFDVALIPHVDSKKTRSMNPLKAFVYLAVGTPVVSTNVYNLDELKDQIWIAQNYEDYLGKLQNALNTKKQSGVNCEKSMEYYTWEERIARIMKWIADAFERKKSKKVHRIQNRRVTIIVPVYNALAETIDCLRSVILNTSDVHSIIVIDDASTDPGVRPTLKKFTQPHPHMKLICHEENQGYTATINEGCAMAQGDLVILNSDTVVTENWLEKLHEAAYSRPDIATVTPLSNAAGAFSIPENNQNNPIPPGMTIEQVAQIVENESSYLRPEVPTGNGFCMYIRREAMQAVGLFDEEGFPHGYGEENDFCQRVIQAGFVNIIDDATFIYHKRSASFKEKKDTIQFASNKVLHQRWPNYHSEVRAWLKHDPLTPLRKRLKSRLAMRVET